MLLFCFFAVPHASEIPPNKLIYGSRHVFTYVPTDNTFAMIKCEYEQMIKSTLNSIAVRKKELKREIKKDTGTNYADALRSLKIKKTHLKESSKKANPRPSLPNTDDQKAIIIPKLDVITCLQWVTDYRPESPSPASSAGYLLTFVDGNTIAVRTPQFDTILQEYIK